MTHRITAALQDLRKTLKNIEAQQAWLELKKAENRGKEPWQLMYDPTLSDLKTELGWFLKTADEIRQALAEVPGSMARQYQEKLNSLELQLSNLDLTESLK
jgi:hypothetical protein